MKLNNYTRGNIYRDRDAFELTFAKILEENPGFVGAEAFIILSLKSEEDQGQILSDLVYFGANEKYLMILGADNTIARVPFEKLSHFYWKEVPNMNYYFPPQIPPKRAGVFEIEWKNSNGLIRNLMLLFPAPALFEFELKYRSQDVHRKIMEADKLLKFISKNQTDEHKWILEYLPQLGVPNEINDEPCIIDDFLGFE